MWRFRRHGGTFRNATATGTRSTTVSARGGMTERGPRTSTGSGGAGVRAEGGDPTVVGSAAAPVSAGDPQEEARRRRRARLAAADLGRSRGGLTTKVHLAADVQCRPLSVKVTADQRGDSPEFSAVLDRIAVRDPRGGPVRCRPGAVLADKTPHAAMGQASRTASKIRFGRAERARRRRKYANSDGSNAMSYKPSPHVAFHRRSHRNSWTASKSDRPNSACNTTAAAST